MKQDKSGRIIIDSSTFPTSSKDIDPKLLKEIQDMTPAFLDALKNKYNKKKKKDWNQIIFR